MLQLTGDDMAAEVVKLPQLRSSMVVDRTKPLPTSLQSDFIPEDILFALTQPPPARDKLGPPTRYRNLNTSLVPARPPAANVWSHKRREQFQHLMESTTCICGAGRDISFLYDVPQEFAHPEKPDPHDHSSVRKNAELPPKKALQLPDTLIPEEYHIIKNRGVLGLEFHEDKYSLNPQDHENHLTVFPSLKPSSRYEVVQLKKTMDDMLQKVGFFDMDADSKGPTQLHNLLELIKKEQNIYNIVFHELIRQVSVECVERGQLLAELRLKYSGLLNKVPNQIMSLHEEVMAQRALDRRLTDELMRFKSTISILTNELSDVKEHDRVVTKEAQKTQEDLRSALSEAQKNAALLAEYHDLYELQRKRLERQVFALTEEREIWSTAAYSLALKVTEECRLVTAKRLHVSEKSWVKLANHFTILLSDRDTEMLTKIQHHVERWRDLIEDFNIALRQREEDAKEELMFVKTGVEKWMAYFHSHCFNDDGDMVKMPDSAKTKELHTDLQVWDKILSKQAELFGGDLLLSNQDELSQIRREMEGWTDCALEVFSRHRGPSGASHPNQKSLLLLNEDIGNHIQQYQYRITGENGVAAVIIHLQNIVETWQSRISAMLHGTIPIQEKDWSSLFYSLEEWVASLEKAHAYVGTTQSEKEHQEGKPHVSINTVDVVRKTQKWATTSSNSIDSEDAKMVEQVSSLHSDMMQWMVQTLLRLAPDREGNSREASEMALLGSVSVPQLIENAKCLFKVLEVFSNSIIMCCNRIVIENTQMRQDKMEENADYELKDLQRLKMECDEWIRTAQILMSQLTGESVDSLFPSSRPTTTASSKVQQEERSYITYKDHEKLDRSDAEPPVAQQDTLERSKSQEQELTEKGAAALDVPPEGLTSAAESQREEEGAPGEHAEEDKPKEKVLQEEASEKMEVIGYDEHTHMAGLDTSDKKLTTTPVKIEGSPDTKKAFEALAAMGLLQEKLFMTEQRAQEAEERVAVAEAEVAALQEELRALRKQLEKQNSFQEQHSATALATPTASAASSKPLPQETPASVADSKEDKDGRKKDQVKPKSSAKVKKKP
ncbi:hypothetical protein C0Q70_17754 [Pomacea canaliculata]|uniref:Axonemal dynein light chain domain-containing protein 1 n=1 Tax=Pomacea canaliculata TaxID=400727 RepID=A0A2T7NLB5_POMCA|nr:axonemal dynein light chain domain-containing protein 1-like isoform X2 [Pomacea canaliculata]PVD21951.1 hypothetical protein C0Q70_17754 [Pomacea canaliculata]